MNNTTQPDLQTLLTRSSQQVGVRAAADAAATSDAAAAASPPTTSSRPQLLSPPKQLWLLPETERKFPNAAFNFCEVHATLSKGVCYSHFGNGVRNGAETH